MSEYEFVLKFKFSDSVEPEFYVDSLAEAGCDDALIGIGQRGRIALDFIRTAENALVAVCSAIKEVKSVIPDAELVEVTPDFVGLSDIAEVMGYSRQNMRKLMVNNRGYFPQPIHEGVAAIWHLSSVLTWLKENKGYEINDTLLDVAKVTMQINLAKEISQLDPIINAKIGEALS